MCFRGKLILNYTDHDLTQLASGYNWIHSDDLKYYSTAHKECKIIKFFEKEEMNKIFFFFYSFKY